MNVEEEVAKKLEEISKRSEAQRTIPADQQPRSKEPQ